MNATHKMALFLVPFALLTTSCNQSPIERAYDASTGGGTGHFGTAGSLVIFSDELRSGGGAFEYPGGENQSLTFSDTSNPLSRRSIRYSWNGQAVSNPGCSPNPTFNFAGFDLMHVPTIASYATTPGRNLSGAHYTKATFFARGRLSTNTVLKIEVGSSGSSDACNSFPSPCLTLSSDGTGDDGSGICGHGILTGNWEQYSISLPPSALSSVKDFFKATFIFSDPFVGNQAPGQGGTAYFDQIQYQQT